MIILEEKMSAISIKNITKRYGERVAVDNISFQVTTRRIHGFLGPNGAGKSTSLKIIAGLLKPDAGEVNLGDLALSQNGLAYRKEIGILPENPPLYLDMSVVEYLSFVCQLYQLPKIKQSEQIALVLEQLKLTALADRIIGNLSKGQKQKVAIAQAIVFDPSVIILDEPMVGLDPNALIEMREFIRKLSQSKTILFSSHQLTEVEQLCQDVTLIYQGKIIASGEMSAVINQNFKKTSMLLEIANADEGILNKLSELDYVLEAYALNSNRFKLMLKSDGDYRSQLSQFLVQANYHIQEMKTHHASLEDVFVSVMQ
jgi:ABC-2 type transport system ATP-binding protein